MTRVIAVANQKGGVGKTTTAINLASLMALANRRVLLIDLDPQGNATTGLGVRKEAHGGATGLLAGRTGLEDAMSKTSWSHLFVLSANTALARFDGEEQGSDSLTALFKAVLDEARASFEFVVIDCPPSLSSLPRLAVRCSDSVMVPIQPEFFSMEGLSQMVRVLEGVRRSENRGLEIEGILFTMFDPALRFALEVVEEVRGYFGNKVFRTLIPRDVSVPESSSFGVPVIEYDPYSRGSRGYVELAKEVL